jgi:hypothetical protein
MHSGLPAGAALELGPVIKISSDPAVELRLAKGPHDTTQSYICSKLQSARILNAGFGAGIFISGN